ncbi:MAG: DNA polymerase III subunit chi [Alphaproteobacteria bacterium]
MSEVLFYHLQGRSLEQTLPPLLEKCLERSWRCVVQVSSQERCNALDSHLWSYRDDGFLPHGTVDDGRAAEQPIWITTGSDNPNAASVRFFTDGTDPVDVEAYERVVLIFDGTDEEAVARARVAWKALAATAHDTTYWQQSPEGRWEKKA